METYVFVILLAALGLVGVVFFLMKGRSISEFDLDVLKGALRFSGRASEVDGVSASEEHANGSKATEVLVWIQQQLQKVEGDFVLNETTLENAKTAAQLYSKLEGEIVATCFFESPHYDGTDFASTISDGARFYRLTSRRVCDSDTESRVVKRLRTFNCSATLTVIEDESKISKIGGIFSRLDDGSYLAFIAMDNYGNSGSNKGLVFSGSLAEQMYKYYRSFAG